ncbi:uncharacterized protein N7484_005921 [Penicillium longicatenatum]|uniref:uncharacterized protein n=1 Tax=Penicillium longicatenatum TaxID=1561947 RepID=UPI0025476034|nr:uncharacterized protein N7484_005921 [Penicillium longicatenatum]KAJ5643414.1 hypothetical protein N7484_005921 [Penicillium longicatenatum]
MQHDNGMLCNTIFDDHAYVTIDSDYESSIAISLELVYSSLFGPLSIIAGPGAAAATPTPTGPVPGGSEDPTSDSAWSVSIYYWQDEHSGDGQWELYQIEGGLVDGGCPEVVPPDEIITDGSYKRLGDGYSGFKAFGSSCIYNGKNLPTGDVNAEVGTLSCDGYRDAICYTGAGDEGSCVESY